VFPYIPRVETFDITFTLRTVKPLDNGYGLDCRTYTGPDGTGSHTYYENHNPAPCLSCVRKDFSPKTCSDGQYASAYAVYDSYDLITNDIQCLPCAPGTFNTCKSLPSCSWLIPTKTQSMCQENALDIFQIQNVVPVEQCYPCRFARQASDVIHYEKSPTKKASLEPTPLTFIVLEIKMVQMVSPGCVQMARSARPTWMHACVPLENLVFTVMGA